MATVIRMARHGKKKAPFYRIVVQDSRSPRDGRFIERLGYFDPSQGRDTLVLSRERLEYWLATGAKPSETLKNRLAAWRKAGSPATSSATGAPSDKPKTQAKEA